MNRLADKYPQEIKQILERYPEGYKRSAVMPLLYLAQRETGYVSQEAMQEIGDLIGIAKTEVATIVGFYTLYHDSSSGKYRVQVCTDLPCALRGADQFLEKLCENLAVKVGETTPDGMVTVEEVKCLAGCFRAPMFQVQSGAGITYHENQTVESAMEVIDGLRQQAKGREGEAKE